MTYLLDWVKQIFVICIITGILMHLVPGEKYQQYIRFACSVIVTLVCIGPVINLLTGEGSTEAILKKFNYYIKQEEDKCDIDMGFMKDNRYSQSNYENAVISYIDSRVLDYGMFPVGTEVVIDWDEASDTYGTLQKITVNVKTEKNGESNRKSNVYDITDYSSLKSELAAYYGINEGNVNIYGSR